MKKTALLISFAAVMLLTGCASRSLYIGGNDGIHIARYSNHGLPIPRSWSLKKLVDDVNISYMALHKRTLYAARRVAKGVCSVDVFRVRRNGLLKKNDAFVIPGSHGYCHISVSKDGKYLFGIKRNHFAVLVFAKYGEEVKKLSYIPLSCLDVSPSVDRAG